MISIKYKAGYKYQLAEDYFHVLKFSPIIPGPILTRYIRLTDKVLAIYAGYAWDGPSGPTIDTKNFMRASVVHDALYQLMREGHLPQSYRDGADKELKAICLEDGMSQVRAWYVYRSVSRYAAPFADPSKEKPIIEAP
jgi:hypothetical protein